MVDSINSLYLQCLSCCSPNLSFIPSTPVTPGSMMTPSKGDLSPITSTPISAVLTNSKKEKEKTPFSIFTPLRPPTVNNSTTQVGILNPFTPIDGFNSIQNNDWKRPL